MARSLIRGAGKWDLSWENSELAGDAADKLQGMESRVAKPLRRLSEAVETAKAGEEISYRGRRDSSNRKKSTTGRAMKWMTLAPIGGVMALVILGIVVFLGLITPAAQINHIVEMVTGKNNFGDMVWDARFVRNLELKLSNTTSGTPTGVEARFRVMTADIAERFEVNGFILRDAAGEEIPARSGDAHLVASIVDTRARNAVYTAENIAAAMETNMDLRTRIERVYNPRWAVWYDQGSVTFRQRHDLWRNSSGVERPEGDVTDLMVWEQMSSQTGQNTNPRASADLIAVDGEDSAAEAEGMRRQNAVTQQRTQEMQGVVEGFNGANAKVMAEQIIRGLSALNIVQGICDVFGIIDFVGRNLKGMWAGQLGQNFMQLGAVAGQIQAADGSADPDVISAIGNRINAESSFEMEDGSMSAPRSGTMGQAFMYVSGEAPITELNGSTRRWVTGGLEGQPQVGGVLAQMWSGGIAGICSAATNPSVRVATTIAGVLVLPTLGAGVAIGGLLLGIIGSRQMDYVAGMVAPMAVRIMGGQIVGEDSVGEEYLDATIIGGLNLRGRANMASGIPGIGVGGAQEVFAAHQAYRARIAKQERSERSPFDVTSRHTFLGSLTVRMMPHVGVMNSASGVLGMMGSMVNRSARIVTPAASALDTAGFQQELEVCRDADYQEIGIATDPFCNPIFGIPQRYLAISPEDVLRELEARGEIEIAEDGRSRILNNYFGNPENDMTGLRRFERHCAGRRDPLTVGSSADARGEHCVARDGEDNRVLMLYALFLIDDRIEDNLSGDGMRIVNSTPETGAGVDGDAGCDDEQSCAERIVELVEEGRISDVGESGWLEAMRRVAAGEGMQPSVCEGEAIGRGSMMVDVTLASALVRLAGRYEIEIEGFGFVGDEAVRCDGGYFTRGMAVRISGLGDFEEIDFEVGQVEEISRFVRDFVGAVRNMNPNATVHIGQTECSAMFASSLRGLPRIFRDEGRGCDHIYLAVVL
ncbi:hypothetical protein FWD07_03265 [Candidatus Saccharibacteria bacterium]|nr:hypothetical protein [Candidatus Saccharibacteria bacterium]